jgi:hypothetical protein
VDAVGNAIVVGETDSGDFPMTANAFRRTKTHGSESFIVRFRGFVGAAPAVPPGSQATPPAAAGFIPAPAPSFVLFATAGVPAALTSGSGLPSSPNPGPDNPGVADRDAQTTNGGIPGTPTGAPAAEVERFTSATSPQEEGSAELNRADTSPIERLDDGIDPGLS